MKKINYSLLYILAAFLLAAAGCAKDKGSFDYAVINKLKLSDTATKAPIELTLKDTLKLQPVITQTVDKDETNLEYYWTYYELRADGGASDYFSLPAGKKLQMPILGSAFVLGKSYRVISEVKDKKTGVSTYLFYQVNIVNEFNQGWLLLEDKSGTSQLSFILPDGRTIKGFAQLPIGKPVKLELAARAITEDLSPSGRRLYVIGETTGFELDYQTMLKKFDYKDLFYQLPAKIAMQYLNWPSSIGIAINDGIVYSNLTGGFPGAKKWGAALLSTKGNYSYKAALDVAGAILLTGQSGYPSVVYDNTNKCFAYIGSAIGGAGAALTAFPNAASDVSIFDLNNTGLTMVFMDSANIVQQFNAIMKDAANVPYLLRFKTAYRTATESPVMTLAKYQMNAPEILNLSAAANSTTTAHLFYAVGGKLYRHEVTSNTTTQPFSFPAGETVTKMDFQQVMPGATTPTLVVATWNGTEGKVYYFPVSSTGEFSTYSNVFTGFSKITDLVFKVPGA
jgi:hypothetical protein